MAVEILGEISVFCCLGYLFASPGLCCRIVLVRQGLVEGSRIELRWHRQS